MTHAPRPFDPSFPFSGSAALRAQVAHAEPIRALSPILIGSDPYNSIIPSLKARAVVIPVAEDKSPADDEDKPPLKAVPIAVPVAIPVAGPVGGLKAVPIVNPVVMQEGVEEEAPPVAKPVQRERPRPSGVFPPPRNESRVKINRPGPIRFND